MSKEPLNKSLYKYVKRLADKKFLSKTGVYKSSWIVREYKKRGGKYSGKKPSYKSPGLKRWYKEKWVDLNRPIRNSKGKIIGYKSCGRKSAKIRSKESYPLCRPLKRVTSKTPKIVTSISKRSILKAKKQKSKLKHRGNIQFGSGIQKRDFKCTTCNYKSKTRTGLKKHIKKYHENDFLSLMLDSNLEFPEFDIPIDQIGGNIHENMFEMIQKHVKSCKDSKCKILDDIQCELCKDNKCQTSRDLLECKMLDEQHQYGGKAQYYGKRSSIMVKVPDAVKRTALYAFKLKKLGFKGGKETGWKRAKQLATKDEIPIEDVKYMRAWFARHIYTSYPTYKKWIKAGRPKDSSWHNKNGIISWLIWSGDSAFKWVNSKKIINLLNKHYNKGYKSMILK